MTLRQLVTMADARREHDWAIASSHMALLAEVNRDRKRRRKPYRPAEFNPLIIAKQPAIPTSVQKLSGILGVPFNPKS